MPVLERGAFDGLFSVLARRGYTVMGPTVADGAIVYGELGSTADLPLGWTDEQDGGHERGASRGGSSTSDRLPSSPRRAPKRRTSGGSWKCVQECGPTSPEQRLLVAALQSVPTCRWSRDRSPP